MNCMFHLSRRYICILTLWLSQIFKFIPHVSLASISLWNVCTCCFIILRIVQLFYLVLVVSLLLLPTAIDLLNAVSYSTVTIYHFFSFLLFLHHSFSPSPISLNSPNPNFHRFCCNVPFPIVLTQCTPLCKCPSFSWLYDTNIYYKTV